MGEYLLRNSLNPAKVVKCSITFRQLVNKNEDGELVWLIQINTPEPHKDGGAIPPVFIHYTSSNNLDDAIREATKTIAKQVDWLSLLTDLRPPFVIYSFPSSTETVVDINSNLVVDIKDILPAAGIDPDSIEVIINDIDVTGDIKLDGDPYQYRIRWGPKVRVYDYY
jgi:hypothetical protein